MVHVAVNRHCGAYLFIALHAAYGNSYIVDHAKAFAMICKGMMEAPADTESHAILQRMIGSQNRPARG